MILTQLFFILLVFWLVLLLAYFWWKVALKGWVYKFFLYRRGIVTTAEITYFLDSLIKVQYRAMFYVKLKFHTATQEVNTDNIKIFLSKNEIHRYRVGQKVKIKYDPANLKNILIVDILS
ncbi:MAG: DUF3592 domain-containing protein [Acinetobacter populi]|jgi:hypothetical protein|uniref:DUF3592 domain-containing protein n=1 Tax=Acinetobacter populi TaxID=1582270 RepID=UPI00235293A0|nr:DUF3592 domain-containing protein [Acinetobacter populi]MCH4248604.1 DUF3592 domain-containing protein [Acinetobacter populi]